MTVVNSGKHGKKLGLGNLLIGFVVTIGVLFGLLFYGYQSLHNNNNNNNNNNVQQQQPKDESSLLLLQQQHQEIQVRLQETEDKMKDVQKKLQYNQLYKQRIQEAIRTMSRKLLMDKFGLGPYFVEIKVAIDPQSNIYDPAKDDNNARHSIVVQLAGLDEMPHTVWWFLEQVDRGLHNGGSIHRNAAHVLQAGPSPNFLSQTQEFRSSMSTQEKFRASGFESVLFQEYSERHPHEKYTLGLAGRPGGPDWYINLMDNVDTHGPGGQRGYDDPTEADPCFAKVISGTEVIDRITKSQVNTGGYKQMTNHVAVVSMTILKEMPQANSRSDGAEPEADESEEMPQHTTSLSDGAEPEDDESKEMPRTTSLRGGAAEAKDDESSEVIY